jgi:hypothetical protein
MAIELNTANYDRLNEEIKTILQSYGKTALITIYSDANAQNIVSDSCGPILARQASSVMYTQSYIGADGKPTAPYVEIFFMDGSKFTDVFKATDDDEKFWYALTTGTIKTLSF